MGRLAEHFIGEIFAARFSDALAVVERSACHTLSNMENDSEPTATARAHAAYLFGFNQYSIYIIEFNLKWTFSLFLLCLFCDYF